MLHLARLAIARPRATLLVWIAITAALAAIGLGVSERLSPSVTVIPGTQSSHATALAEQEFGPSALVPILLQGPERQLDIQGPKLVRDLSARTDTRVMSAWSTGAVGTSLRPRPDAAMIVASVARSEKQMVKTYQAQIERVVDRDIGGQVTASVTGQPAIDIALTDEALDDALRGELIGVAILFVVCIFLLGSVLAAVAVAAVGAATVLAGFGLMSLQGAMFPVDAVAVTLASLAGLALGTGYSLMMVHRFREEQKSAAGHADAARAATAAVFTAGRATLIGGTALIVAMVLAMLLSSIEFQFSVGVGVTACAALGIGGAVAVLPAFLVLAGHRLDAWQPRPPTVLAAPWRRLLALGDRIVRRPRLVGALATAALVALTIPLLSISTGPPNITMLPTSSEARQSFETVSKVMGPGWATPYNVLLVAEDRPLTSAGLLRSIADLQASIARDERVESVLGPGLFAEQREELNKLPAGLDRSAEVAESSKKDLKRLQDGLGLAGAGALELRSGLRSAADGAGRLQGGSGSAQSGAGQLRAGLAKARAGAGKISGGLQTALGGAIQLRDGAAKALAGSRDLASGLGRANTPLTAGVPAVGALASDTSTVSQAVASGKASAESASAAIGGALSSLKGIPGAADQPGYGEALAALQAAKTAADQAAGTLSAASGPANNAKGIAGLFAEQTKQLAAGVKQLRDGSIDLAAGIERLQKGNADLASGLTRLSAGGGDLQTGLAALESGAGQLEQGLGLITGGAGELGSGLAGGVGPAGQLAGGLGTMEAAVAKARSEIPSTKDLEQLKRQSPGLFDSGYFVLAAIEGAPAADEDAANFAVNVAAGGNAGQIVVIPKAAAHTQQTMALGRSLRDQAEQFADQTGVDTALGGPAAGMADFNDFGVDHIAPVVAVISLAIALLFMVALRAVLVPVVTVALDLLATGATFGGLTLLFRGDDPLLGGPGYLDPMSIIGIFAVVFGLAAVYESLLLLRARDHFVASGDARGALRKALRESAWPATGAAIAMVAVAIPFMAADLLSVRQFGVGLALAALINALLVRPVLLPAALSALGPRAWWPTRAARRERQPQPPAAPAPEPKPRERELVTL
jgi:RND superfamily putative drug exporter